MFSLLQDSENSKLTFDADTVLLLSLKSDSSYLECFLTALWLTLAFVSLIPLFLWFKLTPTEFVFN